MRVPRDAPAIAGAPEPQIPSEIKSLLDKGDLFQLKELSITWDSASWDISASAFMRAPAPYGLSLSGEDVETWQHMQMS